MGGLGLILALVVTLGIGSGVMVFKHSVEHERDRLTALERDLWQARAETARLRAELAYHRRPDYLVGFADDLGLVPATPRQLVTIDGLAERPPAAGEDGIERLLVALPSGQRTLLARRPAQGSTP